MAKEKIYTCTSFDIRKKKSFGMESILVELVVHEQTPSGPSKERHVLPLLVHPDNALENLEKFSQKLRKTIEE